MISTFPRNTSICLASPYCTRCIARTRQSEGGVGVGSWTSVDQEGLAGSRFPCSACLPGVGQSRRQCAVLAVRKAVSRVLAKGRLAVIDNPSTEPTADASHAFTVSTIRPVDHLAHSPGQGGCMWSARLL